jgi:Phosphotransferase enzyme family
LSAISPLEPLLPGGRADRLLLLGSAPPAALRPSGAAAAEENVDLALLLPDRHELRERNWTREAVARAAGAISTDGIVYALVPGRSRRRLRAELERAGLLPETPIAHVPQAWSPRYLVPLETHAWRYAFGRLISARPGMRALLRALPSLPSTEGLLTALAPGIGLAARRPGGRPLADWISGVTGEPWRADHAIVGTSWRGARGSVIVHCFTAGQATPWGVAKITPGDQDEGRSLSQLRPAAASAGARVPEPLGRATFDGRSVVAETHVAGRPAAHILRSSPQRLANLLDSLAEWLARWGRATASRVVIDRTVLDEHVLRPAASLRSLLPPESRYPEWLQARCTALIGSEGPLVAAHNDLTMWNVLVDERGAIAVIDWETAEERALPLVDLFYAVTDAVAATAGYRSRLGALQSCFAEGGSRRFFASQLHTRVATVVGVEPRLAELSFHACWLRHAANEHAAGCGSTQFLETVRWVADNTQRVLR